MMNQKQALAVKDLVKPCIDVLEKLGWKWKPEIGECFYYSLGDTKEPIYWIVSKKMCLWVTQHIKSLALIPILHWEEIERVLEGVGYELDLVHTSYRNCKEEHNIEICRKGESDPSVWNCKGKTRQQAIMLAVIQLGKELK